MNKRNKIFFGVIGVFVVVGFVFSVFWFMTGLQKSRDGGNVPTVDIPADIAEHIKSKSNLIVVDEPRPLSVIASPLIVRGQARGTWYFEASFPIILTDWDGRIIAQWYATAQGEWMTEDFVPFEGKIEFDNPSFPGADKDHFSRRGFLIFQKDNPSGLPKHDDALEIPIWFARR